MPEIAPPVSDIELSVRSASGVDLTQGEMAMLVFKVMDDAYRVPTQMDAGKMTMDWVVTTSAGELAALEPSTTVSTQRVKNTKLSIAQFSKDQWAGTTHRLGFIPRIKTSKISALVLARMRSLHLPEQVLSEAPFLTANFKQDAVPPPTGFEKLFQKLKSDLLTSVAGSKENRDLLLQKVIAWVEQFQRGHEFTMDDIIAVMPDLPRGSVGLLLTTLHQMGILNERIRHGAPTRDYESLSQLMSEQRFTPIYQVQ